MINLENFQIKRKKFVLNKNFRIIAACFNLKCAMKRLSILLCLPLVALFFSCSTDVDLYAEYKEIPVIYGILDADADTNYVKITRVMSVEGDAYQVAVNPDSSNYPGKLDVRIVEYCNGDSLREIVLDTITIHNKEHGLFYAPDQKLYYTTEKLNRNRKKEHYSYRLKVVLPDRTLTSKADMVGDNNFGVQSLAVNFSKEYFGMVSRQFLFRPAINATIYQVSLAFTFLEQRTPDGDSVPRTMYWDVGTYSGEYLVQNSDFDAYVFFYRPETFYEHLTEFIGGDTAIVGLKRYISDYPVEVTITAGGEHLRQYVYNNDMSSGFVLGDPEFSLIDGGYGVFSSRATIRQSVRLGGETVPDLVSMTNWGFKFIGGRE